MDPIARMVLVTVAAGEPDHPMTRLAKDVLSGRASLRQAAERDPLLGEPVLLERFGQRCRELRDLELAPETRARLRQFRAEATDEDIPWTE
jgi:hypothetical protein